MLKNEMIKSDKVSVIIPTYNEKENITRIIPKISEVFKKNKINGCIIISDDNSPDGTGKLADNLSKKYPLKVIHRTKNRGYGNSIIDGFKKAKEINSKIVITMDCDFSHNPNIIPKLIKSLNSGADVSIGSRRVEGGKIVGWSLWRHFCSAGAGSFSKIMLGLKAKDVTSGFRAYKIKVLKNIPFENIKSNGYSFLEELLYMVQMKDYKIKEVPIVFFDRTNGESKLSKKEIVKFFLTILRLRFTRRSNIIKK